MTAYKLDPLETKRKPDKEMKDRGARLEIYHHYLETNAYENKKVFVVYHKQIINCTVKNDFSTNCYNYPRFWVDTVTNKIINIVEYQRLIISLWENVLCQYYETTGENKAFKQNLADWVSIRGRRAQRLRSSQQTSLPKQQVTPVVIEAPETELDLPIQELEILETFIETDPEIELVQTNESTEIIEIAEIVEIVEAESKNIAPKKARICKVKLPTKVSSGLRNLVKSKGKVAA